MSKTKPRKHNSEKFLELEDTFNDNLSPKSKTTKTRTSNIKTSEPKLTKTGKGSAEQKDLTTTEKKQQIREIISRKPSFQFKTDSQALAAKVIENNTISVLYGKAGTGKSMISAAIALVNLWKSDNVVVKLYITKPMVAAKSTSSPIGTLPGGLSEKMAPYTASIIENISRIIGKIACDKLLEQGYIEVIASSTVRGMTMGHFASMEGKDDSEGCYLLFDECMNCSAFEIRTILTRLGNCKMIFSGDNSQVDAFQDFRASGLYDLVMRFQDMSPIVGFYEFDKDSDIVRNPLIGKILERYQDIEIDMKEELRKNKKVFPIKKD